MQTDHMECQINDRGEVNICLHLVAVSDTDKNHLQCAQETLQSGKRLHVRLEPYRNQRSLDANAYLWVLCQKIAEVVHSSKDHVYLEMLGRYGVFFHMVVRPEKVEDVRRSQRLVKELGTVTVNGQTGMQLQCYVGSSHYNTKEMSVLIDGIVGECRDLGIETKTPEEIAKIKESWGR